MDSDSPSFSPPPITSTPDWSTIDREILCPLCDYNLRGLTESRCPECGHRFEWADVLAEDQEVRGFFEHAHTRRARAFSRTWAASMVSWWFWRKLKTVHQVCVGRLGIYLLLLVALQLLLTVAALMFDAFSAYRLAVENRQQSIRRTLQFAAREPQEFTNDRLRYPSQAATTQQYLDEVYPRPLLVDALQSHLFSPPARAGRRPYFYPNQANQQVKLAPLILIGWLPATLAVFAIFRVSLRKAGISWPHLVRIAVYCYGVVVLVPALWQLMMVIAPWRYMDAGRGWKWMLRIDQPMFWVLALVFFWLAIRLVIAMHRYLRIPQGVIMALLSQFIVLLVAIQFLISITWQR